MAAVLSREQARAFYDRFGSKQDLQRFYEDPAIDVLLDHAELDRAGAVIELGCGTGRLAARMLGDYLPAGARYAGFDISPTMIGLARDKLQRWADRAEVQLTDGSPALPVAGGAFDRFVSTYVLDLLSEDDIRAVLAEARRVLEPGGRLCLASLTHGQTLPARLIARAWAAVQALRPQWVGGCRPIDLCGFVEPEWKLVHREVVCTLGLCTEVVIAEPSL